MLMPVWSQSEDIEQTEPGLTSAPHSSTAPLRRYYGFQRAIFWLVLKTPLIISLEWMMRIINNQVCACSDGSFVCSAAKWTGRRPLKAHMKMIERAARRTWAKKCSSKWGVPRLTVPLIKMLTPCTRSTVSPVLHIFLLACRCELSPLSTRADTCLNSPGKWGHMCKCVCAGECVCMAFPQEPVWIMWMRIFLWNRVVLNTSRILKRL